MKKLDKKNTLSRDDKKYILYALYITSMVLVNILGSKISFIYTEKLRVSVGIILMPLICCVCDIIQECFGKKFTSKMVNISTFMLLFMILVQTLCVLAPPHSSYKFNNEYSAIFKMSIRMTIASFTSFFVAQRVDVLLFYAFRKFTKGKYLFIRNNISTFISQFLDTCIFMFLAFYKMSPKFTAPYVFSLIMPYWGFKILFSLLSTPFCYLGRIWIGRYEEDKANSDTPD